MTAAKGKAKAPEHRQKLKEARQRRAAEQLGIPYEVYEQHLTERLEAKAQRKADKGVARINRQIARNNGERTYQGMPCRHGHTGIRYTKNDQCRDCVMEKNQK